MEGFDLYATRERAKWIAERIIDAEVPYETEPWAGGMVRIIVPEEHRLLLEYLIVRAENEIDDPSDL